MDGSVSVDISRVLDQVTRQRNAALDEISKLLAYIEEQAAEIAQLRAEIERLKGQRVD